MAGPQAMCEPSPGVSGEARRLGDPSASTIIMGVPTVSFLFVDQVGSTAQLRALGDERAAPVRRAMFDIIQSALAALGGTQVDNTGDGVMATFDSAVAAVEAAAAIQHGVRRHNQTRSTAESIEAKAECLPSRARH